MRLAPYDYRVCLNALTTLRQRMADTGHLFRGEMLSHLLMAHVLDLYDIHARKYGETQVPERARWLLGDFMGMLYNGEHRRNRQLEHYASALCITPHYLSEICRQVSGRPASYWIDRFTLHDVARLLGEKDVPLTEVAERLNFSSLSYFSRYVLRHFGMSPSEYRQRNSTGRQ